jgi:hypothetical protein
LRLQLAPSQRVSTMARRRTNNQQIAGVARGGYDTKHDTKWRGAVGQSLGRVTRNNQPCASGRVCRCSHHSVIWVTEPCGKGDEYTQHRQTECHRCPGSARCNMHFPINVMTYIRGVASHFRAVRKTSVVICPTAQLPAEVGLDSDARMESCSRWPHLEGCSQTCTPQFQFSAEDLSEFAAKYEGKHCASCGKVLTRDDWYRSRLAIPTAHTATPDADPICFACNQAASRRTTSMEQAPA